MRSSIFGVCRTAEQNPRRLNSGTTRSFGGDFIPPATRSRSPQPYRKRNDRYWTGPWAAWRVYEFGPARYDGPGRGSVEVAPLRLEPRSRDALESLLKGIRTSPHFASARTQESWERLVLPLVTLL